MPVLVVLTVFGSILLGLKLVLDYRRERWGLEPGSRSGPPSLGMSELRLLVQEAVEEAVQPLVDRLDAMEPSVRRLAESSTPKALPPARAASDETPPQATEKRN